MNDDEKEKLELARGFVKDYLDRDIEYMDVSEYLEEESPDDLWEDEFTSSIYKLIVEEVARVVIAYQDLVAE